MCPKGSCALVDFSYNVCACVPVGNKSLTGGNWKEVVEEVVEQLSERPTTPLGLQVDKKENLFHSFAHRRKVQREL